MSKGALVRIAGFVIRISVFLRVSSFVIRIWELRFVKSPFRFFGCIGTLNHELKGRHRQGAAGILPAVLSSDWPSGKMPAAL